MLDVTGAFDNVSHSRLIHNLRKRRLDPQIIFWIASFTQNRTTIIKTNECSSNPVYISTGIPQGSPLSPILYLFYNADLLEICASSSSHITAGGFIDDTVLLATSPSTAENCEKLKKTHRLCVNWAKKHASKFDTTKYQLVHLSRKQNTDISKDLLLDDGHIIKAQKSEILLGVEIDNQLKWRTHLDRIKIRASKSITALSCLAGSVWGGKLKTIRLLYQSIVIPQLTYCCSVWYPPPNEPGHRKYVLKCLQSIQGRALKVVTGAFKVTSLPALDIEAFVLPIRQKLDKLSCESLLRIASSQLYETVVTQRPRPSKTKNISPLEILCRRFEKRFNCKIEHLERTLPFITPPWWIPPLIEIAPSKHEAKASHESIIQAHDPQKQLIVYTDGSGINGKIGAAAVIPSQNITLKAYLGPAHFFTVYSGELQKVAMALNSTSSASNQLIRRVTIFTDNQSAIQAVSAPSAQSGQQILRFIVGAIDQLREQHMEVEIRWIPAHIGWGEMNWQIERQKKLQDGENLKGETENQLRLTLAIPRHPLIYLF